MGLFEVGVEVGGSDVGVNGFFVGLVDVDGEDVGSKVGRIVSSSVGLLDGISVSLTGAGVTGFAVGIPVGRLVRGFLVGVGVGCWEIEGIAVVSVGLMVGTLAEVAAVEVNTVTVAVVVVVFPSELVAAVVVVATGIVPAVVVVVVVVAHSLTISSWHV